MSSSVSVYCSSGGRCEYTLWTCRSENIRLCASCYQDKTLHQNMGYSFWLPEFTDYMHAYVCFLHFQIYAFMCACINAVMDVTMYAWIYA